jgi:hypothetical protein
MARHLDWTKAAKPRASTDTALTRKLEFRADRYLAAVDERQAAYPKRSGSKNFPRRFGK